MPLTLAIIENLAPDQASLQAAARLRGASRWPVRARHAGSGLIWGECQGSGANPYRVIADTGDHGYKCTCPSRKFPCKHSLALMWMFAEQAEGFAEAQIPDWVGEWLGRRRRPAAADEAPSSAASKKRGRVALAAAERDAAPAAAPLAPTEARNRAASAVRTRALRLSVLDATRDLDQWIADQLRTGLAGFLAELGERTRRIAARLVDAKAGALASRLDELPARLLVLPSEERLDAAIGELGRLVLLNRAWRAEPDDPELHRAVVSAESRDQVQQDPAALRVSSRWEVLGDQLDTRRDGLVAQSSWLLNLEPSAGAPAFALLLDFHPASAGRRGRAFSSGDQFRAELAFYRARSPLRAVVSAREGGEPAALPWRAPQPAHPLAAFLDQQRAAPWCECAPVLLPAGRICETARSRYWWRACDGGWALPIASAPPTCALGAQLAQLAGVWTGHRLTPLAAQSDWGRLAFDA